MTALARWKDLCLDAVDRQRMAAFWGPATGLRPHVGDVNVSLDDADGVPRVWINAVDRPHAFKNRVHLDVHGSVDDLVARGATVTATPEETGFGWTLMADPEGNELCCFARDPLPGFRLHGIGIDCGDPAAQAAWWGRLLDRPVTAYDEDDELFTLADATSHPGLTLDFARVPEPRQGPNRVHWDLLGDVAGVVAAGATVLWEVPGGAALADPEGNEFCVFAEE